jgi:3-keto-disaccharide hydrolase
MTMTHLLRLVFLVAVLGPTATAAEDTFPGQRGDGELRRDGFTPLFDGTSLEAWDVKPCHEGHWVARDGVIDYDGKSTCNRQQDTSLWTKHDFGDCQLYVEWRLPAKPEMKPHPIVLYNGDFLMQEGNPQQRATRMRLDAGDSGLYFRGSKKCQANIWSQQLGSGEINGYRTDKSMPPEVRRACIPIAHADRPFGTWNAFLITLQGDGLAIALNGQRVIDVPNLPDLPKRGPIALQHHGDPVQFRRIWIKALD